MLRPRQARVLTQIHSCWKTARQTRPYFRMNVPATRLRSAALFNSRPVRTFMISLSIIIPCFNGATTLARALESCVTQPEATQIVVVDDGSTDASAAVV